MRACFILNFDFNHPYAQHLHGDGLQLLSRVQLLNRHHCFNHMPDIRCPILVMTGHARELWSRFLKTKLEMGDCVLTATERDEKGWYASFHVTCSLLTVSGAVGQSHSWRKWEVDVESMTEARTIGRCGFKLTCESLKVARNWAAVARVCIALARRPRSL